MDQRHVGEDVGVAHVIEGFLAVHVKHEAGRIAEIGVLAVLAGERGRVQRRDEGGGERAAIDRAAVIAGIDPVAVGALPDQEHADLEIGDEHRAGLLEDVEGIADMIVVAVGQKHMRDAAGRLLPALAP